MPLVAGRRCRLELRGLGCGEYGSGFGFLSMRFNHQSSGSTQSGSGSALGRARTAALAGLACCLIQAFGSAGGEAAERPIADLVPEDSLVVYMAKPYGGVKGTAGEGQRGEKPNPKSSLGTILAFLNASGLIPDEGQVFADIAAALPLLGRSEHALILLDASSKTVERRGEHADADTTSLRLKHLQTAIVLRTEGRNKPVLQQLNLIAHRYTNREVARLTDETASGYAYQRLVDDRLPGWAIWEWGRLEDFFVVSFGAGAFEKVVSTFVRQSPSLAKDAWYGAAAAKTMGHQAFAQWFIGFDRLQKRLGGVARERTDRVIEALSATNMTHDLWTVGLQGRALTWRRCYRRNGQDTIRAYSDPSMFPARHRRIVPDEARHFAIIHVPTRWLVDNLPRAWVAGQSERNVEKWSRIWRSLEQGTGIELSANLMNHFGENIVIFDFPVHPLEIPFALTLGIEIDDQKVVKRTLDALLTTWGQYLDERAERKGTRLVRVKVSKAEDDIWFIQAGILGPALKVTEGYVVISWCPQALREALQFIEPRLSRGPAEAASGAP